MIEHGSKRFRITIEYDGTHFVGWQRQENGLGVQEVIEKAIEKLSNQQVFVQCAGRTDSGVHAMGQVAHFDLAVEWSAQKIRDGLNYHLRPHQVAVLEAAEVKDDFNARFDAIQRCYLYRIVNRRAPVALDKDRAWWVPIKLDADAMDEAAKVLEGRHDFSTFRAQNCQSQSPVKTLDSLTVKRENNEIQILAVARSFLYHQVRNMAGTLRLVGEGKWSWQDFEDAFKAKNRNQGGETAPAKGLYLINVRYS